MIEPPAPGLRSHARLSRDASSGVGASKTLFINGETLPVTIVLDREGNVRERIEGILLPEEFEEKIKPLLR